MTRAAAAGDHGAAGMVTLFAALLVLAGAAVGVAAAADLSVSAARARSAADAAALAGISVSPLVSPDELAAAAEAADAQARRIAHANHARLINGDSSGWPLRYRVTVEVQPVTRWVRRVVGAVRAEAVGAVRPRRPHAPRTATDTGRSSVPSSER